MACDLLKPSKQCGKYSIDLKRQMKLICVGNGMVGQRFLEQLTNRRSSDALDITVFGEEPRAAYDRVQLTSFFAGKSAIDLNVVPARFFEHQAITIRLND